MLSVQTCGYFIWAMSLLCFGLGVLAGYGIASLKFRS